MIANEPFSNEDVLKSIEPITKAQAPDFFYSKLRLKMENRVQANQQYWYNTSPIAIIACCSVLIFLNVLMFKKTDNDIQQRQHTSTNATNNNYFINTELVYE